MKLTPKDETLIVVLGSGVYACIFGSVIGLDPVYSFFTGVALMYLNWEIQGRLWSWWRKAPKFLGFRYWIKLFWKTKVIY